MEHYGSIAFHSNKLVPYQHKSSVLETWKYSKSEPCMEISKEAISVISIQPICNETMEV
jgi:hypothetical protein